MTNNKFLLDMRPLIDTFLFTEGCETRVKVKKVRGSPLIIKKSAGYAKIKKNNGTHNIQVRTLARIMELKVGARGV
jgi:uncharacterized Zn ribbon protein